MGDHLRAVSGYAQRAPVHAGFNSMYEHVLLPTDGSEPAAAAAWHALGIAGKYDATLHAIFAIDTGTSWLTVSKDEVHDALWELGQETSEDVLRDVQTAAVEADVELVTDVLEGPADERIVEYAGEFGIDLIVMGTHGRAGLEHRLLGSVTERVIRGTAIPVMTVTAQSEL